MPTPPTLLSCLLLVAGVRAQAEVFPIPARGEGQPFVSAPYADGSTWVRGGRYKLGLTADGARFQPLFGPTAARDYPITFVLAGVACGSEAIVLQPTSTWQRQHEDFVRDHGAVREHWRCAMDSAQQFFVVDRPRSAIGELELRLDVRTDMVLHGEGPGVRFVAPGGLGEVRYSDAIVVDASGRRLAVEVDVVGQQLRVVVPPAFVATAAWPLTIDPWLVTVPVDTTTSDVRDARVACDPTSGNWLVVAEEILSATDVDIVCKRFDAGNPPVLLDTVYAHNTSALTRNPDVGIVAPTQLFVVAWHNASLSGSFEFRSRTATSTVQGNIVATSQGIGSDANNRPVVGSALGGDRFLLVMFRVNVSGWDVFAQWALPNGVTFGTGFVGPAGAAGTSPVAPGDVSTLLDLNDKWVVVWRECSSAACTAQTMRMRAVAPQATSGVLSMEPIVTLSSGTQDRNPRIAGYGGRLLALWEDWYTGGGISPNYDIHGIVIGRPGATFTTIGAEFDLTALEPNGAPTITQSTPVVSYDGVRFLCGYQQAGKPQATTVLIDGASITVHENSLSWVPGPFVNPVSLDLAHGASGNPGVHWAVWDQNGTGGKDIYAAVLDARTPGTTSTLLQTGCGAPSEPTIALAGTPALGRTFTVTIGVPAGFPFTLFGQQSIVPLPGCGSCAAGVDIGTMATIGGAVTSWPVPVDVTLLGADFSFQGLSVFQTGGCPPSLVGFDFTVTDTLTVTIR